VPTTSYSSPIAGPTSKTSTTSHNSAASRTASSAPPPAATHPTTTLFTQNWPSEGIRNGDRGTITAGTEWELTIRRGDGHEVTVDRMNLGHGVQLAYATTIHKAQGATADHALLLATSNTGLALTYSALSRGRHGNELFVAASELNQPDDLERALVDVELKTLAIEERRLGRELERARSRSAGIGL
jgi:ATP-dependent exoDNAse (exonuclease V) alpha subunit